MKGNFFGFSKSEVIWFSFFFVSTIALIAVSSIRLINKYYSKDKQSSLEIKKYSGYLQSIHELDRYAVTIQRGSLNLIIYSGDSAESRNVQRNITISRDSLSSKLTRVLQLTGETDEWKKLGEAGSNYLARNKDFLAMGADAARKEEAANYNVRVMRPSLRVFTDLARDTGQRFTQKIKEVSEREISLALQIEFWLLILALLPYIYFFFRFLYLVAKMIIWDLSLKDKHGNN